MAARLTAYLVVAIVAGTLIAGLIVGAQRNDDGPVDLIVHNATVYTADRRGTTAEAVAVRGNQILRVGSNREIARLQRPQTVVVDAHGGTVLPGFNDANAQLVRWGLTLDAIDLAGTSSPTELLGRIREWGAAHPNREWVVGRGPSGEHFKTALPSRQILDSAVPDRPAIVFGGDGSTVWANTAALRLAGMIPQTLDSRSASAVREPRTGEPSGVLKGSAAKAVADLIAEDTREERANALRLALAEANAAGITSVQNIGESTDVFDLYDEMRRSGALTVRVSSAIAIDGPLTEGDLTRLERIQERYPDDPLFKVGALAIRLGDDVRTSSFSPDALNRTVRLADEAGWQIVTHAPTASSVGMSLDAYAHAVRSNRMPERGRRHRIDGVTAIAPGDVPRFGSLGLVASIRPPGALSQVPRGEAGKLPYRALAGESRIVLASPLPSHEMNPLLGLYKAAGLDVEGLDVEGPPAEGLPLKEAIEAYTSAPAWATFDEGRKGTISAGMLADLVVLSEHIFVTPQVTLPTTAVAYTIFDGKIVYQRDAPAGRPPVPTTLTQ